MIGTTIGPYQIIAKIGEGGMGEVYRARDTRLQRDVAIKVLPADVAGDPERLARFEREARTLALLNHPGIAHIHGLEGGRSTGSGQTGGAPAMLIMELVEGHDLAERLASGPLPIGETLAVARQIADALDAAHMAGIIHRDLKPANIKLRADGAVKLLDFGLAKEFGASAAPGATGAERAPGATGAGRAATFTTPAVTQAGVILGTAAYMSPEQARGKALDKRTDVWAFGCVLYEMLTGRPAFDGETVTDVLSAIVKSEPDWTKLPADTPFGTRHLLRRCLEKDASKRLRDIGDAIGELETADAADTPAPPTSPPARRTRGTLAWIAALVMIAAAAGAVGYFARPAPDAPLQKFPLAPQSDGAFIREPVISPDGRKVTYVGRSRLWVQSMDEWEPRELAGTEGAMRPFWSPGSDWIGYFRSEMLLKVPAGGGPVVRIGPLPAVQAPLGTASAAWGDDGTIAVSLGTGPLLRVSSAGGQPTPFLSGPSDVANDFHDVEWADRGALVAVAQRGNALDAIAVVKNGTARIVLEVTDIRHPSYSPTGHLVFARRAPNAGIWAVPFSLERLEVTGEPFLINAGGEPSVARDGTLAFVRQSAEPARQLAWFSLDGSVQKTIAEPRQWTEGVAISRDGRRLLAAASDGLWMYDTETGTRSRVTNVASDMTPDWIDDQRVVFVRTENGEPNVVMKHLRSGSEEVVLARRARFPRATADGKRVVFNLQLEGAPGWQVAWIDLDARGEIKRLGGVHEGARFPSVSPDGTLVSYVSGEIGRDEIFLTHFPSGEGKYQISSEGGGWTLFSPSGEAVLYRSTDGDLMSVPVAESAGELKLGQPQRLFGWGAGWAPFYDLASDGKQGVAAVPVGRHATVPSVSIVQNWQREFQGR